GQLSTAKFPGLRVAASTAGARPLTCKFVLRIFGNGAWGTPAGSNRWGFTVSDGLPVSRDHQTGKVVSRDDFVPHMAH
ncbi:MAG TPA: hypothetical protein VFQ06_05675, partial [Nitrospira sp.]|nr:hypothetical protein [Nitrospira sp.]